MSFRVKSAVNLVMGNKVLSLEANEKIKLHRTINEDVLVEDAQGNRALLKTQKEAVKFLKNVTTKESASKKVIAKVPLIKAVKECKNTAKLADYLVLTEQLDDEVLEDLEGFMDDLEDGKELESPKTLQDRALDKLEDPEGGLSSYAAEVEIPVTVVDPSESLDDKLEVLRSTRSVDVPSIEADELTVDNVEVKGEMEVKSEADEGMEEDAMMMPSDDTLMEPEEEMSEESEDDLDEDELEVEVDEEVMEESVRRLRKLQKEEVEVSVSSGDEVTVKSEPAAGDMMDDSMSEEPDMPVLGEPSDEELPPAPEASEEEEISEEEVEEL